jgi:hypothetical protein
VHSQFCAFVPRICEIERIHARGALVKVLDKPHLDLTTPIRSTLLKPVAQP